MRCNTHLLFPFDLASIFLIVILTITLVFTNPPLIVDDFYHLSVARQIFLFGFIPTWDFWEFFPIGRPHLYPPLLHVVIAFIMRCSGDNIFLAAKVVKISSYPFILLSSWYSARGLAGRKVAFYSTLALATASPLLLQNVMIMPANIVLGLTPLLFLAFVRKSVVASILLLSAMLWLHITMPLTVIATLLAFSLVMRDGYPELFIKVFSLSILAYSPWLLHIINHVGWLSSVQTHGEPYVPLVVWGLAIPSIASTLKNKKPQSIYFMYVLSLTPLALSYLMRFSTYVLISASFFAGMTLAGMDGRKLRAALTLTLAASLLIATPALGGSPLGLFQPEQPPPPELAFISNPPLVSPSSLLTLLLWPSQLKGTLTLSILPIYTASLWILLNNPQPVCYIGLDASHATAVTVFTGLPTTNGMWREVLGPSALFFSLSFSFTQATVYIVEAPFSLPPGVHGRLALDLATIKVYVRV